MRFNDTIFRKEDNIYLNSEHDTIEVPLSPVRVYSGDFLFLLICLSSLSRMPLSVSVPAPVLLDNMHLRNDGDDRERVVLLFLLLLPRLTAERCTQFLIINILFRDGVIVHRIGCYNRKGVRKDNMVHDGMIGIVVGM